MIEIPFLITAVVGSMFLGVLSLFFGWISYIQPNHKILNELFPNPEPKPLTAGRLLFWISATPLVIIATTLG